MHFTMHNVVLTTMPLFWASKGGGVPETAGQCEVVQMRERRERASAAGVRGVKLGVVSREGTNGASQTSPLLPAAAPTCADTACRAASQTLEARHPSQKHAQLPLHLRSSCQLSNRGFRLRKPRSEILHYIFRRMPPSCARFVATVRRLHDALREEDLQLCAQAAGRS